MRAAFAVVNVVVVALGILRAQTGDGSLTRAASEACPDAIYTSPANAPPKPVQAIRIGPTVFNSLANLTTPRGLDKPTKRLPFYTVKSPLTILVRARRGVEIRLIRGTKNAALLYSRKWVRRLASWHYSFSEVPRSARLPLCRDASTHELLNTQFAGGLLLRKPGCVTIEVQPIGESKRYRATVPIGIRC